MNELLHSVLADALEHMAFMEVQPANFCWARIPVLTPFQGGFTLAMDMTVAKEISATIQGQNPEEVSDELVTDVVAELANTVAGRLIGNMVAAQESFDIGLPELGHGALLPQARARCFYYDINGHIAFVMLDGDSLLACLDARENSPSL